MALNQAIDIHKTEGPNVDGSYNVTRTPAGARVLGRYTLDLMDLEFEAFDVDQAVDIDATANTITAVAHELQTGDGPILLASDDTMPGPLVAATDYYVIAVDDDTLALATTRELAEAGTRIDITSIGVGTLTVSATVGASFRLSPGPQVYPMIASVQVATGREVDYPSEHDVTTEMRVVYTEFELWTRRPGFEPDTVELLGADGVTLETWTCLKTERYEHWGEVHFVSYLSRDEVT